MRYTVFLLVIYNSLFAQVEDTLLSSILSLKNDTEKVNRLYSRGFALRNNDPRSAFYYANLCEEQAQLSESKKHMAKSYNLLGILHYKKGNYKNALAYHQKALSYRKECGDRAGQALSEINLGNIYSDLHFFDKAETAYLEALSVFKELGDTKRTADCLINLGVLKQTLKQQEAAYEHYSLALKLGEELNDYDIRSICLNNMAQVYFDKGDYDKSVALNEDALKLRYMMENHLEVTDSYLNLAANFIKLNQLEKAKEYLDTAYSTSRYYSYFEAMQVAHKIYSDYYYALKDFEKAFFWIKTYENKQDSVLAEQGKLSPEFDFDLPEVTQHGAVVVKELHNLWLLLSVLVFIIFVPFMLLRFKR